MRTFTLSPTEAKKVSPRHAASACQGSNPSCGIPKPEGVRLALLQEQDGCTKVPMQIGPTESVFVVFRRASQTSQQVISVHRAGRDLLWLETLENPFERAA